MLHEQRGVRAASYRKGLLSGDVEAVQFEVVDQGSGIDPEVEDNTFEPFISTKQTAAGMIDNSPSRNLHARWRNLYKIRRGSWRRSLVHPPYNKEDED